MIIIIRSSRNQVKSFAGGITFIMQDPGTIVSERTVWMFHDWGHSGMKEKRRKRERERERKMSNAEIK